MADARLDIRRSDQVGGPAGGGLDAGQDGRRWEMLVSRPPWHKSQGVLHDTETPQCALQVFYILLGYLSWSS